MSIIVEIYSDQMIVSFKSDRKTFIPTKSFTSIRLLIGDFIEAEKCLKQALTEMKVFSIFHFKKPKLSIHPMEKTEGGLSDIEKRIFMEMGRGVGVKEVEIVVDGKVV